MILTLTNGTIVDTSEVTFDQSTYHFYWDSGASGMLDITNLLLQNDKINNWPSFDQTKDNYRLSNEATVRRAGPSATITYQTMNGPVSILASTAPLSQVGDTSLWSNFYEGLKRDASNAVPKLGIGLAIAVGVAAFLVLGSRR